MQLCRKCGRPKTLTRGMRATVPPRKRTTNLTADEHRAVANGWNLEDYRWATRQLAAVAPETAEDAAFREHLERPPLGYELALEKRRDDGLSPQPGTPQLPAPPSADDGSTHDELPDGYAIALAARQEAR